MNSYIIDIGDTVKMKKINKYLDWFIHMMGYSIVLITVSLIFQKTIYIDNSYYGIWGLLAVIIIFILNRVVKPTLLFFALPLTAMTLGLTYPLVNMLILKLTDWIMGPKLDFTDIWILFFISIILALLNLLIEKLIIEPIIRKANKVWEGNLVKMRFLGHVLRNTYLMHKLFGQLIKMEYQHIHS